MDLGPQGAAVSDGELGEAQAVVAALPPDADGRCRGR